MSHRINVFLDDREEKLLDALVKKYGGKPPAIMREALKKYYDKAFPPHMAKGAKPGVVVTPPDELTAEAIIKAGGGEWTENGAGAFKVGAVKLTLQTSNPEKMLKDLNNMRAQAGLPPIEI